MQGPLLKCVSKSDKPNMLDACSAWEYIHLASRCQPGNGAALRLWWHLQEFEKLAGRPYVVCFFNADAPMTVLPDTVRLCSTAKSTGSLPLLTLPSCCRLGDHIVERRAQTLSGCYRTAGHGRAAADAGSLCAGVVPGAARGAAAAAPRAAAGHLPGAPWLLSENLGMLEWPTERCMCDKCC